MENKTNQELTGELIKRRRLQILVHSFIYYRLNDSIISDDTFDRWATELINLQKDYPEISRATVHYEAFKDFLTIDSAASLPLDGDIDLASRAYNLLRQHNIIEKN